MPESRSRYHLNTELETENLEQDLFLIEDGGVDDEFDIEPTVDEGPIDDMEGVAGHYTGESDASPDFLEFSESSPPNEMNRETEEAGEPIITTSVYFDGENIFITHGGNDGASQVFNLTEALYDEYPEEIDRITEAMINNDEKIDGIVSRDETLDTAFEMGYMRSVFYLDTDGRYKQEFESFTEPKEIIELSQPLFESDSTDDETVPPEINPTIIFRIVTPKQEKKVSLLDIMAAPPKQDTTTLDFVPIEESMTSEPNLEKEFMVHATDKAIHDIPVFQEISKLSDQTVDANPESPTDNRSIQSPLVAPSTAMAVATQNELPPGFEPMIELPSRPRQGQLEIKNPETPTDNVRPEPIAPFVETTQEKTFLTHTQDLQKEESNYFSPIPSIPEAPSLPGGSETKNVTSTSEIMIAPPEQVQPPEARSDEVHTLETVGVNQTQEIKPVPEVVIEAMSIAIEQKQSLPQTARVTKSAETTAPTVLEIPETIDEIKIIESSSVLLPSEPQTRLQPITESDSRIETAPKQEIKAFETSLEEPNKPSHEDKKTEETVVTTKLVIDNQVTKEAELVTPSQKHRPNEVNTLVEQTIADWQADFTDTQSSSTEKMPLLMSDSELLPHAIQDNPTVALSDDIQVITVPVSRRPRNRRSQSRSSGRHV